MAVNGNTMALVESTNGLDTPLESLNHLAAEWKCSLTSLTFAEKMDEMDSLSHCRDKFHYPKCYTLPQVDKEMIENAGEESIYFCSNSLGLQPKAMNTYLQQEMNKWADMGVYGYFHGDMPWSRYDEKLIAQMCPIVGAKEKEIAIMNTLTINMHLLLISFYRPTPRRYKIFLESKAFPSDHYAIESQIRLKGYDPKDSMIYIEPREGEETLRTEDIVSVINKEGDNIAVVMFSGIQYLTGQLFDMQAITKAGHNKGCYVGFDLAHAVGNVPIHLHEWKVDFAFWCSYKYLNSGAGGIGGAFIHSVHERNDFPRLSGWWSHKIETRFKMDNKLDLAPGAAGYKVSTPPMFMTAALKASLDIYSETNMSEIRAKSRHLTGYLEYLLKYYYQQTDDKDQPYIEIITPADPEQRGAQLSVRFSVPITMVHKELERRGVVVDMREPNVLRITPAPLYNSFTDVHRFVKLLGDALQETARNCNSTVKSCEENIE